MSVGGPLLRVPVAHRVYYRAMLDCRVFRVRAPRLPHTRIHLLYENDRTLLVECPRRYSSTLSLLFRTLLEFDEVSVFRWPILFSERPGCAELDADRCSMVVFSEHVHFRHVRIHLLYENARTLLSGILE